MPKSVSFGRLMSHCVVSLFLVCASPITTAADELTSEVSSPAQIAKQFCGLDLNGDGVVEITNLELLAKLPNPDFSPQDRLLVVMVEQRLLRNEDGQLTERLREYQKLLRADGWAPLFVAADVYAGDVHQDGRTLLAMRRFLIELHKNFPRMGGAVLVGSFPEAMLVRRWAWKRSNRAAKLGGVVYNKGDAPKRTFLAMNPELISHRSDVVLSDLDGNWEDIYVQPRTEVDSIKFLPEDKPDGKWPVADEPIATARFSISQKAFADFFFIDDADYDIIQQTDDELTIRSSYVMRRPELSDADRAKANPIATPEIMVSRINPRHVAVSQPAENLDALGVPRAVPKSQGSPNKQFRRDVQLEQRLLIEYFDRNLEHRKGRIADSAERVAVLTTDLHTPSKRYFANLESELHKTQAFPKATAVDFVRFMKTPVIVRGLSAHSNASCSVLMKGYKQADLIQETGEGIWFWKSKGDQYVPSYNHSSVRDRVHFSLLRTLWENGKLSAAGSSFYIHGGCEAISPLGASKVPYNSPQYGGHTQISEGLLFYGNGLALIGRAKVYYDIPPSIEKSFGNNQCFGELLKGYFEADGNSAKLSRSVASRNKAYFWSIIGDWTLRLDHRRESVASGSRQSLNADQAD